VSTLTNDIGFIEISTRKITPSISKLSMILSRRYNQHPIKDRLQIRHEASIRFYIPYLHVTIASPLPHTTSC
jgi:hypothetical protein